MSVKNFFALLIVLFLRMTTSIAAFVMWPLRIDATKKAHDPVKTEAIQLERSPMPELNLLDRALADEEVSEQLTEADVDLVLRSIRERLLTKKLEQSKAITQEKPQSVDFLVALSQVEEFAEDCLIFGDEQTHQTRAADMQAAFRIWARGRENQPSASVFSDAMTTVLQSRGGHKLKNGFIFYIGAALKPGALQEVIPSNQGGAVGLR